MIEHAQKRTPPRAFLPVLEKLKDAYKLWFSFIPSIPKAHRYTLTERIDDLLVETVEYTVTAGFLSPQEKLPYLRIAIRKFDTAKILLMILRETGSLQDKQYLSLSLKLDEIGSDLGGWHGKMVKENSSARAKEK